MSRKKLYLLSLFSGVLFFLSWPPYGFPFLLFVAFVPLLQIEHVFSAEQFTGKRTFLFGLVYLSFFIWNITTTWWVYKASLGGAAMAILANSFIMAAVVWVFHLIKIRLLAFKFQISNFVFIAFWLGYEFFHHRWDLTWPWLTLGNAFASFPSCIQWYEYTGTSGGSLWVLSVNTMLFSLFRNGGWKMADGKWRVVVIALVVTSPIIISQAIYYSYSEKKNPVNIVVVQPNIDPYSEKFSGMNYAEQLEKTLALATQKVDSTTDYLVCPETALTEDIWENNLEQTASIHRLKEFLKPYSKLKIIIGASTAYIYQEEEIRSVTARKFTKEKEYYDAFNSAFQVDNTDSIQRYHKSKLVPGVECMPYPALFGFLSDITIDLGGMSGSLGTQKERTVFHLSPSLPKGDEVHVLASPPLGEMGVGIAPVICYESIFGEYVSEYVRNGASLIFILTNDGWWGNTAGFKQHLTYGRLRAIETRRSIARSGNTGISCFINQRGDIIQPTEWWVSDAIKGSINSNLKETFYVQNGDVISRISFYVSGLILMLLIAMSIYNRFLRKRVS
jgi:apolipoprotein N-acyltransferase